MQHPSLETPLQVIDESRQGEAVQTTAAPSRPKPRNGRKYYIESYGCQMNFSDSEIVSSILANEGFALTTDYTQADIVLINTCSIREKAEQTVRNRLQQFHGIKKQNPGALIGVLGCMAERLKSKFLEEEQLVDIVVGPDAYRELPNLIDNADSGQKAVNVILSKEETYADISPVRLASNGVTAFISIMRGCDNMCSFCVVPFTRGRERSRDPRSIVKEAKDLYDKGFREVTLLGQNVDSYLWFGGGPKKAFDKLTPDEQAASVNFGQLLQMVAEVSPELRVRFSTSHPKDMTDEVLHAMARYHNICNYIHLPVQSGNSAVLERMNRGYSRQWYLDRIRAIREIIPGCGVSTDIITGFCGETDGEHNDTLSLMEQVSYDFAYMFHYSERPGTLAQRQFEDDVPLAVKKQRLQEVIALQMEHSRASNQRDGGKTFEVLIEGFSKKSKEQLCGRNSQNKMVVFPKGRHRAGEYVKVKITDCTAATLLGEVVA